MENFDVIVVGGSVSGSPTATWLARKGHRVLLVEKAAFPRDTNSTHFVWPRGMSYLNRLGVADTLLARTPSFTNLEVSIEGISLRGHVPIEDVRKRFIKLHGDDHGVLGFYAGPRRFFLDQVLLDEARKSGVDVREQTKVESLVMESGQVVGVRCVASDNRPFEAHAPVVIGADGRISSFADMVGSKKTLVREKSTFAYYSYYSGIQKPELVIHKKGRFGTAIFPTMDDRHLVLVYGPTAWWGDFSRDAEANFLRTYEFVAPDVAALVRRGRRVEDFKAMGRMVAFHRENWGAGWALVGDACSFKDQWTAMGITHALRDAELISGHVDDVLRGRANWEQAMSAYSHARMEDYEDYWGFVCDGAEMAPYTSAQLEFFDAVSRDQGAINKFMAQVGDTVSFKDAATAGLPPVKPPPHILRHDPQFLGYHDNIFAINQNEALAA